MIKIGVIGLGYWGPNLVRNFYRNPDLDVVMAADVDPRSRFTSQATYPDISYVPDALEIVNHPDIQAVAIATPVCSHYPLAKAALENDKHVWVEKPLTRTVEHAEELNKLAHSKNLVLFTDHTFVYTPAVAKLNDVIQRGELGDVYYYDSVRANLGLFQHDVSVLWDLGPHDISIMNHLINKPIMWVQAVGARHAGQPHETIAYITVQFEDNILGHVHINWLAPAKIRQVVLGGSKRMCVYDDTEASEKVKIFDKGVEINTIEGVHAARVQYRLGDMHAPAISGQEALERAATHFVHCIHNGSTPITDGAAGLRVVEVLDAADRSLKAEGKRMYLQDPARHDPARYYQAKLLDSIT